MKKFNKIFISLLAISTLCIGCNTNKETITIEITNAPNNGSVINPEDIKLSDTRYSIESKMLNNLQVLPSTGDVNILVIPILLPDYQEIYLDNDNVYDKDKVINDLNKAFFAEELNKFESVKSFYKKSSFNKLNISGTVTDWFDVAAYTNYGSAAVIDYYDTYDLVREAINWVKYTLKMDLTKYDSDKDGYIDGVWCIYSCPNYTNGGPQTNYGNYWAYTTWGNQTNDIERPNVDNPIYNLFGWASYDFMYDGYGTNNIDARTYIHETGHFLGLSDYYSDQMFYNPIGKADMMDANITDHNSFSKMLLGWTKPYVVTGNTKIDLASLHNENNFIVIPSDSTSIIDNTFNPFSEYILIEYYTNENLNYEDSANSYSNGLKGVSSKGIKIYHVDNRAFLVDISDEINITCNEYNGETIDKKHKLVLPITNYRGSDAYNTTYNLDINVNLFDQLRLIEANNVDTFSSGGVQKDKTLFKTNDTFSLEKYGQNFFINNQKFNNGDTFSYHITIKEVK